MSLRGLWEAGHRGDPLNHFKAATGALGWGLATEIQKRSEGHSKTSCSQPLPWTGMPERSQGCPRPPPTCLCTRCHAHPRTHCLHPHSHTPAHVSSHTQEGSFPAVPQCPHSSGSPGRGGGRLGPEAAAAPPGVQAPAKRLWERGWRTRGGPERRPPRPDDRCSVPCGVSERPPGQSSRPRWPGLPELGAGPR